MGTRNVTSPISLSLNMGYDARSIQAVHRKIHYVNNVSTDVDATNKFDYPRF